MKILLVIFSICLIILSVLPAAGGRGEEAKPDSADTILVEDGRVTIRAYDADLEEILKELSRKADFELFIYQTIKKKVTVDITDLPVEEALRKILPGYGFSYRKSPQNENLLRAVAVLESGEVNRPAYTGRSVARLNYGAGPGQLGRINTAGVERQGPRSFAVDSSGNIYICDTVNGKISVFSPDGKLQRTLSDAGIPTDIAVSATGQIYILDEAAGKIIRYLPEGKRLADLPVPSSLYSRTQSLETLGESIFLRTRDQEEYELIPPGAKESSDRGRIEGPFKGSGITSEMSCLVRKVSPEEGEVKIVGRRGEIIDTIPVPVERLASIVFLGRDEEMNLYLQVEQSREDQPGVDLGVIKMNPAGIILEKIEKIPASYSNWTARLLRVDSKGSIFQMLPGPEAVEVNRWSRKSGDKRETGNP